jgi:regulation of enolase protein 1 (concanavalin A-like superfamily)
MKIDLSTGCWLNKSEDCSIDSEAAVIKTTPKTDFWQRSYYGFRNDNAPALQFESDTNFTFTVKVNFDYKSLFDQCGIIIYLDSENWFKASIEYENENFSRLGSVVTNLGYSDWATTDIDTISSIWYRLSRRGSDFLVESSFDGVNFNQMRIFHLHKLGETTELMGKSNPPLTPDNGVAFGVYACSPTDSCFVAKFSEMRLEASNWKAHNS